MRLTPSRRVVVILLALLVVAGGGLRAHRAANPTTEYQSADERSYGKLALDIAENHHYGAPATNLKRPLHWPPGAPFMFAIAREVDPDPVAERDFEVPAAYWAQAVVGTATILAAFALAALLAGSLAGLGAAALVAFYPPAILATGEMLSEPLGAFLLTTAAVALAWAWRDGSWPKAAAAGALFGLTVLTRADLLLVPFLVAALLVLARRRDGWRPALGFGAALAAGALMAIAPWSIYASSREDRFVPVTQGSPAALFVGTYLPGDGTTVGMKRDLADEVIRRHPRLRGTAGFDLEARLALDVIRERHPSLSRDDAIQREARKNLVRYGLKRPFAFARMMLGKVSRMWTRYARGGARHTSPWIRGLHIVLVLGAAAGLLAGLWRSRNPILGAVLVAVLYSTLLHTLVVAQGRYNLPLMPALIAAGVAGWALARRAREGLATAPRSE